MSLIKYDKQTDHPEEHLQRAYTTQNEKQCMTFGAVLAAEEGINFWLKKAHSYFIATDIWAWRAWGISQPITHNRIQISPIATATTWRYVEQLCKRYSR